MAHACALALANTLGLVCDPVAGLVEVPCVTRNVMGAMNALSWLVGEREAIAIRSKSLNYNYLTISASTASTLRGLMIGVFPLAYLAIGIVIVVRRRRKQNETV